MRCVWPIVVSSFDAEARTMNSKNTPKSFLFPFVSNLKFMKAGLLKSCCPSWIATITCMVLSLSLNVQSAHAQCDTCTAGMVLNDNSDPWSDECYLNASCAEQGNPCQANDVNLIGTFIADANGDPVPTCMPGDMTTVTLWGRFVNGTNTNRRAVRTTTEVLLDGVCQITLNGCSFETLPPGDTALSLLGTINYICGESIQLRNTGIGWETAGGATCANTFDCGDYASSKCSKELGLITFLSSNFDFACGEISNDSTEVIFMNLSSGGTPPLQYLWDFGDGNTSTSGGPGEA
jgi:hypothetical protein